MVRLLPLLLLLALPILRAQDTEMDRLASWMAGVYDTTAQVAEDERLGAAYRHIHAVLKITPVHLEGLPVEGAYRALYLEQAVGGQEDKPYRQRLIVLARQEGRLLNLDFRIDAPEDLVGAHQDAAKLARLTTDRVQRSLGCEVYWTRVDDTLYKGAAGSGRKCQSNLRGATHVISYTDLTPATLTSLDQGFDDAGGHKWGPPPGEIGHIFRKRR